MNSTDISALVPDRDSGGGPFSSEHLGEFKYRVGVSFGILLFLVTAITLLSYLCNRANVSPPPPLPRSEMSTVADVEAGIDDATLMNYPTVLYSEAKLRDKGTTTSSCSICLADYKDDDELRDLPDCGHLFHLKCVDPWLRLHPTCPVCRTSSLPSPLTMPLAEIVPLARRGEPREPGKGAFLASEGGGGSRGRGRRGIRAGRTWLDSTHPISSGLATKNVPSLFF